MSEAEGVRVLLAEDDRFLRKAAETALRLRGFTVLLAADGDEALRIARDQMPNIILLDMFMPKMPGVDVLRALKEKPETAAIPVIMMSNAGDSGVRRQAVEAGAFGYFTKSSLSLEDLVNTIRLALNQTVK